MDYRYRDARLFLPAHYVTVSNPVSLSSCAIHIWVELKACKWSDTFCETSVALDLHICCTTPVAS